MNKATTARYSHHAPCFVGCLDGDLPTMAEAIQEVVMNRTGEEFVVWADADGYVFVSPDTTRAARDVLAKRKDWVINNYRARVVVHGVRLYLKAEAIIEDLDYHRTEKGTP